MDQAAAASVEAVQAGEDLHAQVIQEDWWDHISKWWLLIVGVIVLGSIGWGVSNSNESVTLAQQNVTLTQQIHSLTQTLIVAGNRHHASTAAQNRTIIKLQTENHTLLQEHSASFASQQAAAKKAASYDADVLAFAKTIEGQLAALCAATGAGCPPLPTLPSG
jgi:hypothetical protein